MQPKYGLNSGPSRRVCRRIRKWVIYAIITPGADFARVRVIARNRQSDTDHRRLTEATEPVFDAKAAGYLYFLSLQR